MRPCNPAWRSEGFSVAWGKFTKTRFTIYDFERRNVSEKILVVVGPSARETVAVVGLVWFLASDAKGISIDE